MVAGSFGPGPVQSPGFFRSYPLSFRWFRPNFRDGLFLPNFVGSFWPTLFFNNFLANVTFS